MANIVLCRIDSRLIHGQVVTKWVGQSRANRIAVVSDELDADPFMKNIYLMAAPPNIKVDCYSNQSFAASRKRTNWATAMCWCCSLPRRRFNRPYNRDLMSRPFRLAVWVADQTAKQYSRTLRSMKRRWHS